MSTTRICILGGHRVSAVQQGLVPNIIDAMNNGVFDHGYTISFGKLHEFLCGLDNRKIKRAALFGSRPPPNDEFGNTRSVLGSNYIWKIVIMPTRKKR